MEGFVQCPSVPNPSGKEHLWKHTEGLSLFLVPSPGAVLSPAQATHATGQLCPTAAPRIPQLPGAPLSQAVPGVNPGCGEVARQIGDK